MLKVTIILSFDAGLQSCRVILWLETGENQSRESLLENS